MDKTVNALFDFNEYTEVGEVADFCCVAAADCIFLFDVLPGIVLKLFETEAHLALVAVESEDNSFDFVADLEEVLSAAEVLAPAHLAYVNKTLYARLHLNECTVVSHDDNFAVNVVADFEIGVKVVPWMGHKLLETESDAFFSSSKSMITTLMS